MKFATIYVDPAWDFTTYSDKGKDRSAEKHYSTMTINDICALPVEAVAADDCALFMWATNPRLPDAFKVGAAWGFEYATIAFVWAKQVASRTQPTMLLDVADDFHWFMGMGYWCRANVELCLLFTRGNPKRLSRSVRQLLIAPVKEHSRKPDEAYERIEKLVGGSYLELFARRTRPGWTSLGNAIDGLPLEASLLNLSNESPTCESLELEKSL